MNNKFGGYLRSNQEQKRESNLSEENGQLRNKIEDLKFHIKQLEEENSTLEIEIEQVKLISNVRNKENYELDDLKKSLSEKGQLQPVLLTSDNFLVAGHRRYTALKELKRHSILAVKMNKSFVEIKAELEIYQLEENYQRKSLDNFEVSDIFQKYIDRGFSQLEISDKLQKPKSYVSQILKLQKLIPELKSFLTEFQNFAWSKSKYESEKKKENFDENFYNKNKGMLGFQIIWKLAKLDEENQRKSFYIQYQNRLTDSELKEYFGDFLEKKESSETLLYKQVLNKKIKSLENISKEIFNVPNDLEKEQEERILTAHDLIEQAIKILSE